MNDLERKPTWVTDWANSELGRPPGSFIDVGSGTGTHECLELLQLGWRGLFIDPDPTAIASLASTIANGILATALMGMIDLQARKIVPYVWTPPNGYQSAALRDRGGYVPMAAVGIHPSELNNFFTLTDPPLPLPRFLSVDIGRGSFDVADVFTQWAEIAALKLTVHTDDEARRAGAWISAGWRVEKTEGLTVWATRFL